VALCRATRSHDGNLKRSLCVGGQRRACRYDIDVERADLVLGVEEPHARLLTRVRAVQQLLVRAVLRQLALDVVERVGGGPPRVDAVAHKIDVVLAVVLVLGLNRSPVRVRALEEDAILAHAVLRGEVDD
jgi:hypothetical protein